MKKVLSLVLCALMLMSVTVLGVSAADYDQPFEEYTLGSERFRIPALYTLNDGSVIAGADVRYSHGSDSPNNIDITVAISKDGYTGWEYNVINYFDDYSDDQTATDSASYIDSAIAQSSTGRIFVVADLYPTGGGWMTAGKGTGYAEIDGVNRMLLTDGDYTAAPKNFKYYIGDNGVIYNRNDKTATEYTVDEEFRLYKNSKALMMDQKGSEGVQVQQNVFYKEAELSCYLTAYLSMRYSDDNGKTWSAPQIISSQVKESKETFVGIGPGRGLVTKLADGTERILFCVYDNAGTFHDPVFENASVIYSDDNGVTWNRCGEVFHKLGLGKTSEAQLVQLTDGVIRMYARNNSNYIAYADSLDGGETWTDFVADKALEGTENCMVSFINTEIAGKRAIICSSGGNVQKRADGIIRVGFVDEATRTVNWATSYRFKEGFFGYSCLTQLSDGNYGILYEDEAAHIQYMIFSVDAEGNINEINGNNDKYEPAELSFLDKIAVFFKGILAKILALFDLL